ncbi:hypothetical protein [Shimia sp.]|uniref:hypothetical protein n=1 Tax=Shimia sp. TaxID=1954381 RepID=UPI003297324B
MAQTLADWLHFKRRKLVQNVDLREEVIAKLKSGRSPEQTAGSLKIATRTPYRIFHETIYQYAYSKDGLFQELGRKLAERRRKRKPRYAHKASDRVFPLQTNIQVRRFDSGS